MKENDKGHRKRTRKEEKKDKNRQFSLLKFVTCGLVFDLLFEKDFRIILTDF